MSKLDRIRSTISNYSGDEFLKNLERICEEFHSELGVLTFGMIVYDESTPEFRKILRDEEYWDALNAASGDKMIIFAFPDEVRASPIEQRPDRSLTIDMLTAIPRPEWTNRSSYSRLVKEVFGDEIELSYPSALFFQVKDRAIHDYAIVPFTRKSVWESAKACQDLFCSIAAVLDKIIPECYGNQAEIFNLVKDELSRQKYKMYLLQGPKSLSDLITVFRTLVFR